MAGVIQIGVGIAAAAFLVRRPGISCHTPLDNLLTPIYREEQDWSHYEDTEVMLSGP